MCTHRYTHGHRAFTNHFFFFLNFSAFLSLDSGKRSVGPREAYTANKTKRFVGEEVGVPLVAGEDAISRVSALCVCVCVWGRLSFSVQMAAVSHRSRRRQIKRSTNNNDQWAHLPSLSRSVHLPQCLGVALICLTGPRSHRCHLCPTPGTSVGRKGAGQANEIYGVWLVHLPAELLLII